MIIGETCIYFFLKITSNEDAILGIIFSILCIEKGVYTEYP